MPNRAQNKPERKEMVQLTDTITSDEQSGKFYYRGSGQYRRPHYRLIIGTIEKQLISWNSPCILKSISF